MNEKRARGVKAFRTTAAMFQTNAARSLVGLVAARRLGSRVHPTLSILDPRRAGGLGVSEQGFVRACCVDDAQRHRAEEKQKHGASGPP